MNKPRIIVTGYGRHGKDSVCELLQLHYGLTFVSSSYIMAPDAFALLGQKYGYKDLDECHEDRDNHREEWFNLICAYNNPDASRLGKRIFASYDAYCGLRNSLELDAMRALKMYDHLIWVDASQRKPVESSSSMTVTVNDADYILDNNVDDESLNYLTEQVHELALYLGIHNLRKTSLKKTLF